MGKHIKKFPDGSFLEFDQGAFDQWCVYYVKGNGERSAPKDVDYFRQLQRLAATYGKARVYRDYIRVYELTGQQLEEAHLDEISKLAASYGDDAVWADVVFSILYMAMLAEEQRRFTRLGKRIKRLGVYKLLCEGCGVEEAANFMRGMSWRDIAALCQERGF